MEKVLKQTKRLFIYSVTKRFLIKALALYMDLFTIAVTILLLLIAVFGGSINIKINWDSWQKLLKIIQNVW